MDLFGKVDLYLYAKATFKKAKLPRKSENTLKGNLWFILPGFYS